MIREGFHSHASNLSAECGLDLSESDGWTDTGDLEIDDSYTAFSEIEDHMSQLLDAGTNVVALGGDHSITYPILRAYAEKYTSLNIFASGCTPGSIRFAGW